jgi:hypothetical protein
MTATVRVLLATTLAFAACGTQPPLPRDLVVWKPLAHWSGRGNLQTENFTSDTGGFRVHWSMENETKKDAGRLHIVLRSMDSGREIVDAVDVQGAGDGVEEIAAERPRWYYLTIDSTDADWTVSIDERIDAQRPD